MKKVQVITGGGSGMGLNVAKVMGKYGPVLIGGRTVKKLDGAIEELKALGIEVEAMPCDVADPESVKTFAQKAAQMGEIATVVNAAGMSPAMASADMILSINMQGTVNVVESFYPHMGDGSVLINIASMAGHMLPMNEAIGKLFEDPNREDLASSVLEALKIESDPGTAYCVSKRFVMHYTARNTIRFAEKGARIISISPGTFDTPMIVGDQSTAEIIKSNPVGKVGDPKDIADLIEYLCSDKSGFITGCDILIDGGYSTSILVKQL